jgi:hypothetical protein
MFTLSIEEFFMTEAASQLGTASLRPIGLLMLDARQVVLPSEWSARLSALLADQ